MSTSPIGNRVLAPSQFDRSARFASTQTPTPAGVAVLTPTPPPSLNNLEARVQDSLSLGESLSATAASSVRQLNTALQSLRQLTNSGGNASLGAVLETFQSTTLPQNLAQLRAAQTNLNTQLHALPADSPERQSLELELQILGNTLDLYQAAEALFAGSPLFNPAPSPLLALFSPAQQALLASDPEARQALLTKLEAPENKALLSDFLALSNSSEPQAEQILASLQLLVKTQPESALLLKLLPPTLAPLGKVVLQQKDTYLSQTLLSDPAKLARLTERLSELLNQRFDSNDLLGSLELLALSRQELEAISGLLPPSGAAQKLIRQVIDQSDFLSKTGLANPEKREKILADLGTLAEWPAEGLPDKKQLKALASLVTSLGAEIKAFKAFLPPAAQKWADAFSKNLSKYQTLNPQSLERFIDALATLSDEEVNAQDAGALLTVISIGGKEVLNFKEFLPERLQGYLTRLLDDRLLGVIDVLNGKELSATLEAALQGQNEKTITNLTALLKQSGKVLLGADQQKALAGLLDAFLLDADGQKILTEALATGDEKRLTELAKTLQDRTSSLNSSLQPPASPTPAPAPTPAASAAPTPAAIPTPSAAPETPPLTGQAQENFEKAVKKLELTEAEKPLAQKIYAQLSEKEADNLTKALKDLDGPMRAKILAVFEAIPSSVLQLFLGKSSTIKELTEGLGALIENFDKLKLGFQKVLPLLVNALEKSLPIIGAQQSFSDAQRLMGIAQSGSYTDPQTGETTAYTDPTVRAMALIGAGLNQADTGLAALETLGIGLVGMGPQFAMALGSAGLEIMMGIYNADPASIPANLKEGIKALALTQALISPQAAEVVKELYGVEGTGAILAELGDSLAQLDQTETGRIATARILLLKAEFPEGIAKAFKSDVLEKGGKTGDFLLNQLKAGSLKVEDLFAKGTGALSQASRALLARFAASSSEALQTVYSKLIAQPSDELFQFTRQALESGLLKLEEVVAGLKGADGKLGEKALNLLVDLFKDGKIQLESAMDAIAKVIADPAALKDFAQMLLDKAGNRIDAVLDLVYQKGVNIADLLAERVLANKLKAKEGLQILEGFVERQAQALGAKGAELLAAFKAKVGPLLQSATRVAQATSTQVKDITTDLKKTLTDISSKLKNLGQLGLEELRQLLEELDRIGDDVIAALGDSRFGKEAQRLFDRLSEIYKQADDLADKSLGPTKAVLLKISQKAKSILSDIAQGSSKFAAKAAQTLESTRKLFRDVVLRNEDELADVARRLGLDSVPESLKKLLGGLDPKEYEAAIQILTQLSPQNAQRLLAVLDFLPDFAVRNIFQIKALGAFFVDGVTKLFETLESQIRKPITGPMLKEFSEKIAKGLGKAIPALGAALSGYDTARTAKIFATGQDFNGNTYNNDARMLAYIASKVNALDTALGIAEFIPGAAVLSAAPSIALALGSTALDIMADYYNDPKNPMDPALQGKLMLAAQGLAVATLDPVGFIMLSKIAGDQAERTADALVDLVQSGKPKAEIEKFVKSLSKNWSQNDDITRLFLRKLDAKGIPLRAGAFSDETLKLLFKNLDGVIVSRTPQDYTDMRTLAMAGGPSVRAYAIDVLSAQQTNDNEESIIYALITQTDNPQLDKLLTALSDIQRENKRNPAGVNRLIYELEDNPVRLKGFVVHLAKEKSTRLDEVFNSRQLNNQQVLDFARTLLADKSIVLSDEAKLAIFSRAAQEGDLALVEKLLTGSNLKTKQRMIGMLANNLTRFQGAFSANTQNAGKVASWILAYGSKAQIETAFTGLDSSLKSWFGRGTDIIKQALDYAAANKIDLKGKLTRATLQALVGNLDSNWSKLFGNHAENLSYVKRLADISDTGGKAAILNSLISGWTPTQSEELIFNILNTASDSEFVSLINTVGAQRIADELNSPSLSGAQRGAASKRLGQVMARIVLTFANPNEALDGVLKDITGRGNIMSDDIVDAMVKSLYNQGRGAALGKINDTNLDRLMRQYAAYKDGNFIYLDEASKVSINRLKGALSVNRLRGRR